jgi:hypothetical protein
MMDLAVAQLQRTGLIERTVVRLGTVDDLPPEPNFDAATLIGVLHHLPGNATMQAILRSLAMRLKPGAALILAGNRYAYASRPLLLAAWRERWRMHGATEDEVQATLGKVLRGADPAHSPRMPGSARCCSSSPASSGAHGSRGGLRSGTPPGLRHGRRTAQVAVDEEPDLAGRRLRSGVDAH